MRIFWTGEEVCSREVSPGHLKRVSKLLGRKPLLWDNYPVNDGDRMSRHLHLRGFTGRPAGNAAYLAGHAINPALQPVLTTIPAITLAECYRQGPDYQYGQAAQNVSELVDSGVVLSSDYGPSGPTYLFNGLNDIKPAMIAEATAAARESAQQFARDAEAKLGSLRRANQGVFQILARDQAPGVSEQQQLVKTVRVVSTFDYYLE